MIFTKSLFEFYSALKNSQFNLIWLRRLSIWKQKKNSYNYTVENTVETSTSYGSNFTQDKAQQRARIYTAWREKSSLADANNSTAGWNSRYVSRKKNHHESRKKSGANSKKYNISMFRGGGHVVRVKLSRMRARLTRDRERFFLAIVAIAI